MTKLSDLARTLRGLLGVTGLGGAAGALVGAFLASARGLVGWGAAWAWPDVIGVATGGFLYGATCGLGFGLALLAVDSKRSLRELPLWRMAALGALLGAGVPVVFMLLTSGLDHFLYAPGIVASVTTQGAVLGGLVASSMVALAQRADRAELAQVDEVIALIRDDSTTPAENAP